MLEPPALGEGFEAIEAVRCDAAIDAAAARYVALERALTADGLGHAS